MSGRNTRSNSVTEVSSKQIDTRFSLDDVKTLIQLSENRIISKLESIVSRIDKLDEKIDRVKAEQIRLDLEVEKVKQVVVAQQQTIEAHEAEKRQLNLIFSGVPEADVLISDDQCLSGDAGKVGFLCQEISSDFDGAAVESCSRLGKPRAGHNRLLKVKFARLSARDKILYSQKRIRENPKCASSFGRIFVNKDSSPLMRKEEKRLRDVMFQEKQKASPDTKFFIKSGKLFRNNDVIDRINFVNQLF